MQSDGIVNMMNSQLIHYDKLKMLTIHTGGFLTKVTYRQTSKNKIVTSIFSKIFPLF